MIPGDLGAVLQRGEYELAALYLLLGMLRALESMPDHDTLLDVLSQDQDLQDDALTD